MCVCVCVYVHICMPIDIHTQPFTKPLLTLKYVFKIIYFTKMSHVFIKGHSNIKLSLISISQALTLLSTKIFIYLALPEYSGTHIF